LAQGLAYLGLELDRLARHPEPGPGLRELRHEVNNLLAEVRETLRQLRSRVTENVGLADLLQADLPRFETRTGVSTRLHADPHPARLSLPVEQEVWRIAQEALSNIERHAGASTVNVACKCDGRH